MENKTDNILRETLVTDYLALVDYIKRRVEFAGDEELEILDKMVNKHLTELGKIYKLSLSQMTEAICGDDPKYLKYEVRK